jgi:hypothetical protein
LILSCNTAQTYGTELGRDVPQEEEITVSGELLRFQKVTMHLTFGNK